MKLNFPIEQSYFFLLSPFPERLRQARNCLTSFIYRPPLSNTPFLKGRTITIVGLASCCLAAVLLYRWRNRAVLAGAGVAPLKDASLSSSSADQMDSPPFDPVALALNIKRGLAAKPESLLNVFFADLKETNYCAQEIREKKLEIVNAILSVFHARFIEIDGTRKLVDQTNNERLANQRDLLCTQFDNSFEELTSGPSNEKITNDRDKP